MNRFVVLFIVGTIALGVLFERTGDGHLVGVVGLVFMVAVVYLTKRKPGPYARDSDLCLSLADIVHSETPRPLQDNHVVFFWQPSRCITVAWSGRFLNDTSTFSLSPAGQAAMTELFDDLRQYHGQHRLAQWNIAHFYLAANRRRFDLSYNYSQALEEQSLNPSDYVRQFM